MPDLSLSLTDQWPDIREGVTRICEGFPNDYWKNMAAPD